MKTKKSISWCVICKKQEHRCKNGNVIQEENMANKSNYAAILLSLMAIFLAAASLFSGNKPAADAYSGDIQYVMR